MSVDGVILEIPSKYSIEKQIVPLPDVTLYVLRNEGFSVIANMSLLYIPNINDDDKSLLKKFEAEIKLGKDVNSCGIIYNRYTINGDKTYNVTALGWHILRINNDSKIEYFQFESVRINSREFNVIRNILSNVSCIT